MELETRLREHLRTTGQVLEPPPAGRGQVVARANRRARNRRVVGGSLASVALVASSFGAYQLVDRNHDQSVDATGEGADTFQMSEDASLTGTDAAGAIPESTGPVLDWTEVDAPGLGQVGQIVWAGSAFVAIQYDGDRPVVMTSPDGSSWAAMSGVPETVSFWGLQASGQAIALWGSDLGLQGQDPANLDNRLFVSLDAGGSWTDLGAIAPSARQFDSPYLTSSSNITGVAVNADTVTVAAVESVNVDFERIVADEGLRPAGSESYGYGMGDGQISVCLDMECSTERVFRYDELGFSADEARLLDGQTAVKVYRSVAGGSLEPTEFGEQSGYSNALVSLNGGFVLSMSGPDASSTWSSVDGSAWIAIGSTQDSYDALVTDGKSLYRQHWGESGSTLERSADAGRTWTPLEPVLNGGGQLFGGPSGLAVTYQYQEGSEEMASPATIEKDGYVVTWLENGLTLTDAATGDVILEFGDEDSVDPPETVIEEEDGNTFKLTFLDPETLEPLVSIDQDDMSEAFGYDVMAASSADAEQFLGWSADGDHWGWQSAKDAFGANGWAQITVGDGVVIALFQPSVPTSDIDVASSTGVTTPSAVEPSVSVFIARPVG